MGAMFLWLFLISVQAAYYTVYDNAIRFTGWDTTWSWNVVSNTNWQSSPNCGSASIKVDGTSGGGFALRGPAVAIPAGYTYFQFYVNSPNAPITLSINIQDSTGASYISSGSDYVVNGGKGIPAGSGWVLISVSFSQMGFRTNTISPAKIYWKINTTATYYLDEITFADVSTGNGACTAAATSAPAPPSPAMGVYTVYDDAIKFTGWDTTWSWYVKSDINYQGNPRCGAKSIQVIGNSTGGFALRGQYGVTIPSGYKYFQFHVAASSAPIFVFINLVDANGKSLLGNGKDFLVNGGNAIGTTMTRVSLSFSQLNITASTVSPAKIYWRVNNTFTTTFYLDNIVFTNTSGSLSCVPTAGTGSNRLRIVGGKFSYNGKPIFLSGANVAWSSYYNYANEFGVGHNIEAVFTPLFKFVNESGGNSVRQWVHFGGENNGGGLVWNSDGSVAGMKPGFINDTLTLLNLAYRSNIFVVFCLWSFQLTENHPYLYSNPQSYVTNALIPWVRAVKGHPALAAWEIHNEPEGCVDFQYWGWKSPKQSMLTIQKFINQLAHAIRNEDGEALVTVGSWSFLSLGIQKECDGTDPNVKNYYTDTQLVNSNNGQYPKGTLQFYAPHYYNWSLQKCYPNPFRWDASALGLDKPVLIGEFSEAKGNGTASQMLSWALNHGYLGAWDWQLMNDDGGADHDKDSRETIKTGLSYLKANYPQNVTLKFV